MDQTLVAFPDHNQFSRERRYPEPPGRFTPWTMRDKGRKYKKYKGTGTGYFTKQLNGNQSLIYHFVRPDKFFKKHT